MIPAAMKWKPRKKVREAPVSAVTVKNSEMEAYPLLKMRDIIQKGIALQGRIGLPVMFMT